MRVDRDPGVAGPGVQGFSGKGGRVDGTVHPGGLTITPLRASDWSAPAIERLAVADVADLLGDSPEFLLLGTGPELSRPPVAFVAALEAKGIGVEAMDSRAAARAWGVLRGEGRNIVAALLPL